MGPIEAFIGLTLCDFFFRCQRHWAPHFQNVGNPVNNKNISLVLIPLFSFQIFVAACLPHHSFLLANRDRWMPSIVRLSTYPTHPWWKGIRALPPLSIAIKPISQTLPSSGICMRGRGKGTIGSGRTLARLGVGCLTTPVSQAL